MATFFSAGCTFRLHIAAFTGDLDYLKDVAAKLDNGRGLKKTLTDVKDDGGRSALHYAASGGKTNICKFLVQDLGIDVDLRDKKGDTPLNYAAKEQNIGTAVFLIDNGANVNLANDKGLSALHYAAEEGQSYLLLLQVLISKGAEVDAESEGGAALHYAISNGHCEAVKILLDNNANPNSVRHEIFTALKLSMLSGSFECLTLLLKAGANPNLSAHGETPLGLAVSLNQTEVIKCLLKAGANPNSTDSYNLTPLEAAALYGNHEAVMILLPVTSQFPAVPDWSLGGILKYVHSEEAREKRELYKRKTFKFAKSRGKAAFVRGDYLDAICWYTKAILADPLDATVFSNRSLCWARLNKGQDALSDAEACIRLRPNWAKAHYRKGAAWKLLGNYHMAAEAFSDAVNLDPKNEELQEALREFNMETAEVEFEVSVFDDIEII
ncbi:hypothetical protein NMG60_11014071 [Bertholletia excelsa]